MFSLKALFSASLFLSTFKTSCATIYVTQPSSGSTCRGGEACTVSWLDNGDTPLVDAIGITFVGLYTGKQQIVQSLTPVDVASVHSFTFTPIPEAGPDSDTYYIGFTSESLQINGTQYEGFSPFFKLEQMSGSFQSPLASATSSKPVPSSIQTVASADPSSISTITVGTLSTSLPPLTSLTATSPASSSTAPSSRLSSSSTGFSSTRLSAVSSSTSAASTDSSGLVPTNNAARTFVPLSLLLLPLIIFNL